MNSQDVYQKIIVGVNKVTLIKQFLINIKCITVVLAVMTFSAAANALTFNVPSTSSNGSYTLTWSGGNLNQKLYESMNGGSTWTVLASSTGGSGSYSYPLTNKPAGSYRYWLQDYCFNGGQTPVACGDYYGTITVLDPNQPVPMGTGSLPSFQLGKADLVSLSQASSLGLYSGTTHSNGTFGLTATAPEITDLANSIYLLSNNNLSEFVKRAYNYVYSEIAPEFRFGLSKGALGTFLDKSGTPFDQAQLFKEIVDVKLPTNSKATFTVGEATFTGTQFLDWTGISNAKEACQLLANGGIPASINGTSPSDCNLSGGVSSVTMVHVWVDVPGYGTADPSFKKMTYTSPTSLLDSYISYNRAAFISAAAPATVSSTGVADQLQNLSRNYYNNVAANQPKATTSAVVGNVEITNKKVAADALVWPQYGINSIISVPAIPDQLRTKVTLNLYSVNVMTNTPFSVTKNLFADETYGRHIAFQPIDNPMKKDNGACALTFDGAGKEGGFYVFSRVELEVNHPYAAKQPGTSIDNSYMDEKAEFMLNCQLTTTLVQGYGVTGDALEESFLSSQAETRTSIIGEYSTQNLNGTTSYFMTTATSLGNVSVGQAAYRYLAESSRVMNFFGNLTQSKVERHHVLGFAGQSPKTSYDGHYSVKYQGLTLDLHNRVSASVRDLTQSNAPSQLALGRSLSWLSSTTEGGAVKRANGAIDAFSTAERIGWGVEKNVSFYKLTPGASVPTLQLMNFPAPASMVQLPLSAETQPVADKLKSKVQQYLIAGYTVTIPAVAIMGPGELAWTYNPSSSSCIPGPCQFSFFANLGIQYGATFYAEKASTGEFAHILVDQSGFSKGGGASIEAPKIGGSSLTAPKTDDRQKVDTGVQKTTGNVDYSFKNVITLGSGALPYGLSTNIDVKTKTKEPRYSSAPNYIPDNITNADSNDKWWRAERMFEVSEVGSANFSGDISKYLGARTPLEAATTVAAMKALLDINSASDSEINANSSSPNRFLISALISRWMDRQADDNTLRLTSPRGSTEFVRQANGSYLPQPGSAESVSISGSADILQAVSNTIGGSGPGNEHLMQSRRKTDNYTFTRTFPDKSVELYTADGSANGNNPNLWHPLTTYKNASGVSVTYTYNGYQNLVKLSNSLGRTLYFKNIYDVLHKLEITDDAGRKVTVEESAEGVKFTGLDNQLWIAALSKTATNTSRPLLGWALTGVYSPESSTNAMMKYTYDNNWRAIGVDLLNSTANSGSYWANAYQWALLPGYANAEKDSAGSFTSEYFDNEGHLAYSSDALGVKTLSTYDSWGRATEARVFPSSAAVKTIPNNGDWTTSLDASVYNNSYIQRTGKSYNDKSNPIAEMLYPNAANVSQATLRTDRTYDDVCSSKVKTESFRYAEGGSATTSVTNEYDQSKCLLTKTTTVTGLVTNYTYNSIGLPTLVTEGSSSNIVRQKAIVYNLDNVTKFTTSKSDGSNPIVVNADYTNPVRGDLTSLTDPRGNVTTASYDNARRITETFAPYLTGSKYFYDVNGRLNEMRSKGTDGGEAITKAYFNPLGWMTSLVDPASHSQSFEYDTRGFLTKVTDAENRATKYTYNANGKLTCQQDGFGSPLVRSYKLLSYDDLGRLIASNPAKADSNTDCVVDNNSYKTTLAYDAYGQLQKTTFPDGSYEQLTYNTSGTTQNKRTRKGDNIAFTYDSANRVKTKVTPDTTVNYQSYDVFSHPLQITQGTSTLSFAYDFMDRVASSSQNGRTVGFGYDVNSNRTSVTWPEGYTIDYSYDNLNRPSLVQANNKTLNLVAYAYVINYNANLVSTTVTYANGTSVKTEAKKDGALSKLTHDVAGTFNDVSYDFGTNAVHQITSETLSNRNFHWRPKTSYASSYATNNLDQYTAVDNGSGAVNFAYDGNGNLTTSDKGVYTYDAENKLTRAVMSASGPQGALTVDYNYDANGRRTQKSVTQNSATTITQYLSEGDNEIAEYLNGSATPSKRFIYGKSVDEIIAMQDVATNSYSYAHRDHEGSVIAVSDAAGNVSTDNTYTYSAYGEPETLSGKGSAGFPYRYTGRRIDTETGLYYYRARYYDSQLGRFLQTDPIGYRDQMNLYAYVGGDPVNKVDSSGKTTKAADDPENIGPKKCGCDEHPSLGKLIITALDKLGSAFSNTMHNESAEVQPPASETSESTESDIPAPGDKESTLQPGPYAGESIPARGPGRDFTPEEREKINQIGEETGCHTCGTTDPGTQSGNFVPDHQPPNAINPPEGAQELFPHCIGCSRVQGGQVRGLQTRKR